MWPLRLIYGVTVQSNHALTVTGEPYLTAPLYHKVNRSLMDKKRETLKVNHKPELANL